MKNILIVLIAVLAFVTPVRAQLTTTANVTAATPALLLSGGKYVVQEIMFLNSSTNAGSFWLYDSPTNTVTNIVKAATVSISTVNTNWSDVFTNATGIVITNTFTGVSHVSTSVAASTNELTRLRPSIVPAGGARTISGIALQPQNGVVVYSTVAGIVEVTYKRTEP